MFRIEDIADEAKKIIGICDEAKLFRWCGDVVELIANKTDSEAYKGFLDLCTVGCCCAGHTATPTSCRNHNCGSRCISLPREVGTVIAVNIEGHPALGYGQLFNFHLNGPGDCHTGCDFSWLDQGKHWPTYRDLITPAKLVAYLATAEDNNSELTVFGYDVNGVKLRRQENGVWLDGYRVPTIFGVAVPDVGAPTVARITGVFKSLTAGSVRLSTLDDDGTDGVLLSVIEPDETLPQYRRIKLNRACKWVRIAYLKANRTFSSRFDHVPLNSRMAFLLGMQARKEYAEHQLAEAHAYEADAARLEIESQLKLEAPLFFPVQVVDRNGILNKCDRIE